MTRTWCELGPPVSISQPLPLEKVEDLWEAWVTWQLLSPGLGLSLLASGLVSCVSCWCEPTRGSSLLRSPPVLLSPFPHRMSCLYSACFRTGSWGSCWKREAWLLMISIQCEQCNQRPCQRTHLFNGTYGFRSSAPGPSILLCLSRLYLQGKKEECTFWFFRTFLHARILPVYGNVRSLAVFPQYGASSSCIGSPGFDNDRCFFSRQILNLKRRESGFMMKEHLIERGTFGLRFCWNVDPEEESQQMSRLAMIWSKNLVDVEIVGEWNCHFLFWKSHQLHEIFRWSEYPATSRGAVSSPHPNHLFPLWIFHSFLVWLFSLLAPSIANLARGCKGLSKALGLSAIQIGQKRKT